MYRMVTRANNTIAVKKKKKYGIIYLKVAKKCSVFTTHKTVIMYSDEGVNKPYCSQLTSMCTTASPCIP